MTYDIVRFWLSRCYSSLRKQIDGTFANRIGIKIGWPILYKLFWLLSSLLREGLKKPIESVFKIIPCRTPPPLFFENCDRLRVFFSHCFFSNNWVIRYVLKLILVMFQTNFGYVLGEIYPKNVIDRHNQFQEIGWKRQDLYGHLHWK